jgi:hypothetical protein
MRWRLTTGQYRCCCACALVEIEMPHVISYELQFRFRFLGIIRLSVLQHLSDELSLSRSPVRDYTSVYNIILLGKGEVC